MRAIVARKIMASWLAVRSSWSRVRRCLLIQADGSAARRAASLGWSFSARPPAEPDLMVSRSSGSPVITACGAHAARAQGCLDSHPHGVMTVHLSRGLPGSMRALKVTADGFVIAIGGAA